MPKLAVVVSALFLLGSASACGVSGTSDAVKTTTTVAATTTTEDESTTTTEDDSTTTTEGASGEADADAYIAGLIENFEDNDAEVGELLFNAEQAECVATEWVDIIGVDTLNANGVVPDDLSSAGFQFSELGLDEDQASAMVDALDDCGLDPVSTLRDALAADYDDTQRKCLDAELDDETLHALLVDTLYLGEPGPEVSPELERIDETCELE